MRLKIVNDWKQLKCLTSVTKIGNSVFYNCYKLTNFQLPSNIREVAKEHFRIVTVYMILFFRDVEKIDFGAFICCHSLKSIKIPSSIEPGRDRRKYILGMQRIGKG